MMLTVRTTVTLDPDVEQLIRDAMQRGRKGFKETLNDAVRRGLGGRPESDEHPFKVDARPMGLKAGVDARGFNRLSDELETEGFLSSAERSESFGSPVRSSERRLSNDTDSPSDDRRGPSK